MRCKLIMILGWGLACLFSHGVAKAQTPVPPPLRLRIEADYHQELGVRNGQELSESRTGLRLAPATRSPEVDKDLQRIIHDLRELQKQLQQGRRQPTKQENMELEFRFSNTPIAQPPIPPLPSLQPTSNPGMRILLVEEGNKQPGSKNSPSIQLWDLEPGTNVTQHGEEALLRALQERAKEIEQKGKSLAPQTQSKPMPLQWQIVPNPGTQPSRFQVEPSGVARRTTGVEGSLERKLDLILWELTELRREMTTLKERLGKGSELHFQLQARPGSPITPWQMKEIEKKGDLRPKSPQPSEEANRQRLEEMRHTQENQAKLLQQQAQEEHHKAQQQRQRALQNQSPGDGSRMVDRPPGLEQILQRIMHELGDLRREVEILKSKK